MVDKGQFDTLLRDHAETVRRVVSLEECFEKQLEEINEMKLDVAKLSTKISIYAALAAFFGSGLAAVIIAIILSFLKLK